MECSPYIDPIHLDVLKGSSNFKELCKQGGLSVVDIEKRILFKSQFKPERNSRKERREVPLVAFP